MADAMDEALNESINLNLKPDTPKPYRPMLSSVQNDSDFTSRNKDAGLMDRGTKSSVTLKNGQINISASNQSSIKVGENGQIFSTSFEDTTITNRYRLYTDEVIINNHKMNPALWQLTDFKVSQADDKVIIGDLCFDGSVLAKVWDSMLKKYVLMRVPYRGRMFSWVNDVPKINKDLSISDPSEITTNYPVKQTTESVSEWYAKIVAQNQTDGQTTVSQESDNETKETTVKKSDDGNTVVTTEVYKNKDLEVTKTVKTTEVTKDGIVYTEVQTYDASGKLTDTQKTEKKAQVSGTAVATYKISYVETGKTYLLLTVYYSKLSDGSNKIHRQVRLEDKCKKNGMLDNTDTDLAKDVNIDNDSNTYYALAKNTYQDKEIVMKKE